MKKIAIFIVVMCVAAYFMKSKKKEEVLTTSNGMKYVKLTPITDNNAGNNTGKGNSNAFQGYEIKDPGIQNMSAILLQLPSGWQAQN